MLKSAQRESNQMQQFLMAAGAAELANLRQGTFNRKAIEAMEQQMEAKAAEQVVRNYKRVVVEVPAPSGNGTIKKAFNGESLVSEYPHPNGAGGCYLEAYLKDDAESIVVVSVFSMGDDELEVFDSLQSFLDSDHEDEFKAEVADSLGKEYVVEI